MNSRNKSGTDIGKIGDLSIKYRSYISQILDNFADIIGTDIPTNILYRYLGRGPITNISLIYLLIYRDINYIVLITTKPHVIISKFTLTKRVRPSHRWFMERVSPTHRRFSKRTRLAQVRAHVCFTKRIRPT
ncbi:hypothetical protein HanHA300_Chr08g0262081 [Helianthus annuus]|nr:hypothetical protein HanHA300_Chr08g0262081 [Helianthus annuus]KAJ0551903.1 hypothetical protein HanHA89_Chr08g0278931 [Helianthus annuus]